MTSRQFTAASLALAAAFALTGCAARQKPQKLTPQAFAAPRTPTAQADPGAPIKPTTPPPAVADAPKVLAAAGSDAPPALTPPPTAPADTRPAVGKTTGQYLTLGGVVAEVNSNPIYASKVLA
ncbi:MAG TPA: hypothetical protein VEA69_00125, partial [Tepidisphaeraceae bacterium]|nr:hypothetical protein [Tepidisphaeraceae bacterium]